MRAIISVSDKTGLADFAARLAKLGVEVYSTGGTKKILGEAGVEVKGISELTGFPEILDGRVKTLHPVVHGGLLARRDLADHMHQLKEHGIGLIDLVVVNLYPFVQTVAKEGVTLTDALENIDIGGPTLIRAAAKNFPGVIVLVDPADYELVLEGLAAGELGMKERQCLARKAFQHVAVYDTAISQYLTADGDSFPEALSFAMTFRQGLRYGENPHQPAAFYAEQRVGGGQDNGITGWTQLHGKELSYNNILDADAAWAVVMDYAAPTVAIIKHTNACGLASHQDIAEAYARAFTGDEVAAFGGIVALNRKLTLAAATAIKPVFYEIVMAPEYEVAALELLKTKKDLRILQVALPPGYGQALPPALEVRRVKGGYLVQATDTVPEDKVEFKVVTKLAPTETELRDLRFTWRAVKHIKSNAILLGRDATVTGMGAGQPSRIVAAQIAIEKAGGKAPGSVLASDAMFPFGDVVEAAAGAGVTAIVQPGGSIRDAESIEAADAAGMAMVFTGERHFKH